MKTKRGFLALLVSACLTMLPAAACAGNTMEAEPFPVDISIDGTNFPDAQFREYVSGLDLDGSGGLSAAEIAAVTGIDCSGRGIGRLDGLGHFSALTALNCADNNLRSLDLRRCPALTELDCSGNQLTELDLRPCPGLVSLCGRVLPSADNGVVSYGDSAGRLRFDSDLRPLGASVSVTFDKNADDASGTMAAQQVLKGLPTALSEKLFAREGWTFTGWNTRADGSGTPYVDKAEAVLTEDVTLYAQWKRIGAAVYGNNLSVEGKIGLNFYVVIPEELVDDSLTGEFRYVDIDGEQVIPAKPKLFLGNIYEFGVSVPADMDRRRISLKLFRGNGEVIPMYKDGAELVDDAFVSSVYDYLARMEDKDVDFAPLARAMRSYCEYARKYYEIDTDIAYDLDDAAVDLSLLAPYAAAVPAMPAGLTYVGISLTLESDTSLRLYFSLDSGHEIGEYSFKIDGTPVAATPYGGYFYIEIPAIPADLLDNPHTVNVNDAAITNVSALSYTYNALCNKNFTQLLKQTVMALYYYNQAANDYFV